MNNNSTKQEKMILKDMKVIGSTLFDDVLNFKNGMDYKIKPVNFKEQLVGRVKTAALPSGDNLFLHHAIYQAEPGDILVIDGQGFTESAYLGEIMAAAAQKLGIKGIIIDGLIRDQTELQSMDIQIYAKGSISTGPSKNGPGTFNETITCGGVVVSPGDYLVADEDGVVIIPKDIAEETLEKAKKKMDYEKSRIDTIHSSTIENQEDIDSIKPKWFDETIKKFL